MPLPRLCMALHVFPTTGKSRVSGHDIRLPIDCTHHVHQGEGLNVLFLNANHLRSVRRTASKWHYIHRCVMALNVLFLLWIVGPSSTACQIVRFGSRGLPASQCCRHNVWSPFGVLLASHLQGEDLHAYKCQPIGLHRAASRRSYFAFAWHIARTYVLHPFKSTAQRRITPQW